MISAPHLAPRLRQTAHATTCRTWDRLRLNQQR
jgi:hypothetical protein